MVRKGNHTHTYTGKISPFRAQPSGYSDVVFGPYYLRIIYPRDNMFENLPQVLIIN